MRKESREVTINSRKGGPGSPAGMPSWHKSTSLRALSVTTVVAATMFAAVSAVPAAQAASAQAAPVQGYATAIQDSTGH